MSRYMTGWELAEERRKEAERDRQRRLEEAAKEQKELRRVWDDKFMRWAREDILRQEQLDALKINRELNLVNEQSALRLRELQLDAAKQAKAKSDFIEEHSAKLEQLKADRKAVEEELLKLGGSSRSSCSVLMAKFQLLKTFC